MLELALLKAAERKIAKWKAIAKDRGEDLAVLAKLVDATPEQIRKAAEFQDHIAGARKAGKEWWADALTKMKSRPHPISARTAKSQARERIDNTVRRNIFTREPVR